MKLWNKKEIKKESVAALREKFGLAPLEASILARRGLLRPGELLYFLEENRRFLHNPFDFVQMEDAVDRILAAVDEGEKVLVFGDRDVDGITATAVLYEQLKRMGLDVSYRLPSGDEAYGLSRQAVEAFAKDYGSLLITVDCGISNAEEIALAKDLGISVIVTDHHTPPESLPAADIILNPKLPDSGYPFSDISGCAVAFKLCEALRFSQTELYKQDLCLLNVRDEAVVECLKIRNLSKSRRFEKDFSSGAENLYTSGLLEFLKGEQIFVWDSERVSPLLKEIFGSSVEFNLFDMRREAAKIIPSLASASLERLLQKSTVARYSDEALSEMDAFYNVFVTCLEKKMEAAFPQNKAAFDRDAQLASLSVLSDIMPLKDENRILVRLALSAINSGLVRPGLVELFARQGILGRRVNCRDLGWTVIPALNAAGRIGTPEESLRLFLEESPQKRDDCAQKIMELNEDRKRLESSAWEFLGGRPERSLEKFNGKFCMIVEEKIHRGVVGRMAAKLVQRTGVPSIAVTRVGESYVGSMRTARGVRCVEFLDAFGDIYINHGGHAGAAGFSLSEENFQIFKQKIFPLVQALELGGDEGAVIDIDAELSEEYVGDGLMRVVDKFAPYGNGNPEIAFMCKRLKICSAQLLGKGERQHLKLYLQAGQKKWPALWWDEAGRLGKDFNVGDCIDLAFHFQRNSFNGREERQLVILDARKSL